MTFWVWKIFKKHFQYNILVIFHEYYTLKLQFKNSYIKIIFKH